MGEMSAMPKRNPVVAFNYPHESGRGIDMNQPPAPRDCSRTPPTR
jgi:hypothetical protein